MRLEAHLDESGTDAAEVTVAGYLFESARFGEFCDKWNAILNEKDVSHFHMVEFAPGKSEEYSHLSKLDRIRMQMRLMSLIKAHAINGIVCNMPNDRRKPGPSYAAALQSALENVVEWANVTGFDGDISYFFEAGAEGVGIAEGYLARLSEDPARSAHRYAGHAFVPKIGNPGVQAADFLAWQYHNFTKKRLADDLARLDMRALLRLPHAVHDECGAPPIDSRFQSVDEASRRFEAIHYLPRTTAQSGPLIDIDADSYKTFTSSVKNHYLACPTCLRTLGENISIAAFNEMIKSKAGSNIRVKCICGEMLEIPPIAIPYASTMAHI